MRAGSLCGGCGARCVDPPTELEPLAIACPECEEQGCEACGDTGRIELTGCPRQFVDLELYQLVKLVDWFEKGVPPVAGGSLNQSEWFLNFASLLTSETSRAEIERLKRV